MPDLDLTSTDELRIANRDALEVRIANQTVWTRPEQIVEHSVFGTAPLADYAVYDTGNVGSWLGNNFYMSDIPYRIDWQIVGVRIWIPLDYDGPALEQSGYVSINRVPDSYTDKLVGEVYMKDTPVLVAGLDNSVKTAFTSLQPGWNNIYFDTPQPMKHGNGFILAYTIGNGTYYVSDGATEDTGAIQASDGTNLYLSSHFAEDSYPKRGEFGIPEVNGFWSAGHYGIDAILREPPIDTSGEHSIWGRDFAEIGAEYTTGNDLGAGGWAATNFYSYSEDGPQEGWTLVGARVWLDAATDPNGLTGMTAECGYYIKEAGAINLTDDTPQAVIEAVSTSPTVTTTLVNGWNDVYFDTPVEIPWGSGIAIGWKIGDGSYYSAAQLTSNPVSSYDGSPFRLAASDVGTERRGEFRYDSTNYAWSWENLHYGADIIVKEP